MGEVSVTEKKARAIFSAAADMKFVADMATRLRKVGEQGDEHNITLSDVGRLHEMFFKAAQDKLLTEHDMFYALFGDRKDEFERGDKNKVVIEGRRRMWLAEKCRELDTYIVADFEKQFAALALAK